MTTSISNAPEAEAATPSRAPTGGKPAVAGTADGRGQATPDASPARTLASRFIILVVCLAVVLSTLAFGTVHAWSLALFQAGAGLVALLWALDAWRARTLRVSRNLLQLPLLGLFVVGLVQLLPLGGGADAAGLPFETVRTISLDPYATRMTLVQLSALVVYFAAALVFIDTPRRLRLVVRTLILFGTLLAVFGLMQYFLNPTQIYWLRQPRYALPFGPFINRHHFGAYMELALALPLGLLFTGAVKRDLLPLYVFAVVVMGIALVATASRGAMLSLGAEVIFLVAVTALVRGRGRREPRGEEEEGSRARKLLQRVGLQVGFGLALIFGVLIFGGGELISRTADTITSENVTSDRTTFWRGTKEIIRERPWLGAGLGAFGVAYTRHDRTSGAARLEQAHNDYLQLLSDAGVVGGLLGLVFVVSLFRQAFARMAARDNFRRGVASGALAGCFAVLVHSLFEFSLHIAAVALLFLVLAALATLNGRVEEADAGNRRRRRRSRKAHAEKS